MSVSPFEPLFLSLHHFLFPGVLDSFLCSLVSKASACNVGDLSSIPGSGRSPGEGNGNPLHYSCLENPMDRGAWWAIVLTRVGHNLAPSLFLDGHGPGLASLKPAHPSQTMEGTEGTHGRHFLCNAFFWPSVCLSFPRAVMVPGDPRSWTVMSPWCISTMTSERYMKVSRGAYRCPVSIGLNLCN